jgi:heme A synthase
MVSHVAVMALFALLVSIVFAVLQRDEPRQQLRLGALLFGGFLGVGVVLGWLMLAFPIGS